jgi:hypothetical protein
VASAKFAGDLRSPQNVGGLGRLGRLAIGGLNEQILDDVNAAGSERREQGSERDLLMIRSVACVVDDDVELAADLVEHRSKLGRGTTHRPGRCGCGAVRRRR